MVREVWRRRFSLVLGLVGFATLVVGLYLGHVPCFSSGFVGPGYCYPTGCGGTVQCSSPSPWASPVAVAGVVLLLSALTLLLVGIRMPRRAPDTLGP